MTTWRGRFAAISCQRWDKSWPSTFLLSPHSCPTFYHCFSCSFLLFFPSSVLLSFADFLFSLFLFNFLIWWVLLEFHWHVLIRKLVAKAVEPDLHWIFEADIDIWDFFVSLSLSAFLSHVYGPGKVLRYSANQYKVLFFFLGANGAILLLFIPTLHFCKWTKFLFPGLLMWTQFYHHRPISAWDCSSFRVFF